MQKHEEWLYIAHDDLRAAKKLICGDEVILPPAMYHAQQCVEKSLKGYLFYKKSSVTKTLDFVQQKIV